MVLFIGFGFASPWGLVREVGLTRGVGWLVVGGSGWLCSNLNRLVDVDSEYLCGTIPSELARCTGLEQLSLNDNLLTGTVPAELGRITALQILNLGHNRLTGTLSRGLFALASNKEWKVWKAGAAATPACSKSREGPPCSTLTEPTTVRNQERALHAAL